MIISILLDLILQIRQNLSQLVKKESVFGVLNQMKRDLNSTLQLVIKNKSRYLKNLSIHLRPPLPPLINVYKIKLAIVN